MRAAAQVFAQRGLEATTMADIATAAGVSVAYLERLGTKADIFAMAIEVQTIGPAQNTITRVGEDTDAVFDQLTRADILRFFAVSSAEWNARSYRLWRMWAASSDLALQERWRSMMADIREAWVAYLARFDERGWWRTDIPRSEQVATIWILTMAETYGRLTEEAGFTHAEYVAWLRRGLEAVLVPPEDAATG